jgi:hypothetical protein
MSSDPVWDGAQFVERWAGEVRVNLVRLAALVAFYGWHFYNYTTDPKDLTPQLHTLVTAITVVWAVGAIALHGALVRRVCRPWTGVAVLGMDTLLATTMLLVVDGPKSPLVVVYLLIVGSAALRMDLRAVWAATAFAAIGYAVLCGHSKWRRPETNVPRRAQVTFALALGAAGLLAGQAVRQARRLARDYAGRVTAPPEEAKP